MRWLMDKKFLWILTLTCILIVNSSYTVRAKTPSAEIFLQDAGEPKCWPLDIVLVIDQSGSMSGTGGNNDPENYRYDAARDSLDQLISNRQDQCPEATHRIAIVAFGENGTTYLPLRDISLREDDDPIEWSKEYLSKIDEAQNSLPESYTDFVDAFKEAQRVFERAPRINDPVEYGSRRQVVIFITDGKPTAKQGKEPQEDHLCRLKNELAQPFWSQKTIWIVALNASDAYLDEDGCSGSIRQDLQGIALDHNGQLKDLPYNEQAIPTALSDIVAAEFGQTSEVMNCEEVFYVDPYLQKIKFRFYRNKKEEIGKVTVTKLDNQTQEPIFALKDGQIVKQSGDLGDMFFSSKNYRVLGFKEEYVIDNPLPGAWIFNVDGWNADDCRRNIESRKIPVSAEVLLEPSGVIPQIPNAPYYEERSPIYFSVALKNQSNLQPLSSIQDFPLKITLNWRLPSGNSMLPNGNSINPISLYAVEAGKWENKELPILTPESGTYRLEIVGTALSGDKKTEIEIFKEDRTFQAKQLTWFNFSVLSPSNGAAACNQITSDEKSVNKPVDVKVQIMDNLGNPVVNPIDYVLGLDKVFAVDLIGASGSILDQSNLTYQGNGIFAGTLLDDFVEPSLCEKMVLNVKFTGSYDGERYALLGEQKDVSIERVEARGVKFEVVSPKTSIPRFDSIWQSCSEDEVSPILIQLRLTDLTGQKLLPNDVLGDGATSLFSAYINGPLTQRSEKIDLFVVKTSQGYLLSGSGGNRIKDEGNYSLEIIPNPNAFARGYTWAKETTVYEFAREDDLFRNVTACKVAWGIRYFLYFAFLALFVFAITGGPGGVIHFLDDKQDLIKTWRLSSMRVMSLRKYSSSALKDKGIKYVQFSRGSAGKNARAVQIKIVDTSGEVIWDSDVLANLSLPVIQGVNVEYTHPKHKEQDSLL